ncbi:hypothetical protein NL108_003584, partial [Boleophthalmus pectinirostris]
FIQKLVTEVEEGGNTAEVEQREMNNLYPLLMQHSSGRDSWTKGNFQHKKKKNAFETNNHFHLFQGVKESAKEEKYTNM